LHVYSYFGFLGAGSPTTADVWLSAFTSRMRELGWIEDRNIRIDVHWAEGRHDRSAEIAAELVRLKVDVILTYSSEHTQMQNRRPRLSRLYSRSRQTLSVVVWSPIWRGPAAM
jgi:hypothetical protein